MNKNIKKIDLTQYADDFDDNSIRVTFFNDYDLQRLYLLIYNHNPLSLPRMVEQFNATFRRNVDKRFIISKLKKIENFQLFEKKTFLECKQEDDFEIIKTHNQWLVDSKIPHQLKPMMNKIVYYYLTDKGDDWVDIVAEIIKKRKGR